MWGNLFEVPAILEVWRRGCAPLSFYLHGTHNHGASSALEVAGFAAAGVLGPGRFLPALAADPSGP